MNVIKSLRDFQSGRITESALQQELTTDDDIREYLEDEEFMQECTALCLPVIIQGMMTDDDEMEKMDESVRDAFITCQNYLIGQGLLDEAAAVKVSNPNISVMHLGKQARINWFQSIITLKMARRRNSPEYKKYKIAIRLKKENMKKMKKKFGKAAAALAKKLVPKVFTNSKVNAVVESKKKK